MFIIECEVKFIIFYYFIVFEIKRLNICMIWFFFLIGYF